MFISYGRKSTTNGRIFIKIDPNDIKNDEESDFEVAGEFFWLRSKKNIKLKLN